MIGEDLYQIGVISRTHGLKGEVMFNFTDDVFDTTDSDYLILEVDGMMVPFFMDEYRFRSDTSVLVRFTDIDTVDDAQSLVGCSVYLEKSRALQSDSEEVSLRYFVGFSIKDENRGDVGKIVDIDDMTENWLFIVETAGGEELLVPAHDHLIREIDHEAQSIVMDLPEGLLDI